MQQHSGRVVSQTKLLVPEGEATDVSYLVTFATPIGTEETKAV